MNIYSDVGSVADNQRITSEVILESSGEFVRERRAP